MQNSFTFQDISIEGGQGSLTPIQFAVMEQALRVLKEYFHAGGIGLEKDYLNESEELKSLKNAMFPFSFSFLRVNHSYFLEFWSQTKNDEVIIKFISHNGWLKFWKRIDSKKSQKTM